MQLSLENITKVMEKTVGKAYLNKVSLCNEDARRENSRYTIDCSNYIVVQQATIF